MADELHKELHESIAYFEQILDVLPGERTALEFLCVACLQLGDQNRFLKHALALADVIIREQDAESAAELIEKLKDCDDPRAKAAVIRLQVVLGPKPNLEIEKPEPGLSSEMASAQPAFAVQAELELLEQLVTEGLIARNHAQPVAEQLTALASSEGDILISALAILEKENLPGAAEAIAAVADQSNSPPVPLESFDLIPADVWRLPKQLVRVRGTIPFSRLGGEWGVATLNPLDEDLREEVEAALGAKCHFFLAPPARIEQVLERLLSEGKDDRRP